jgi:hypothetical protein
VLGALPWPGKLSSASSGRSRRSCGSACTASEFASAALVINPSCNTKTPSRGSFVTSIRATAVWSRSKALTRMCCRTKACTVRIAVWATISRGRPSTAPCTCRICTSFAVRPRHPSLNGKNNLFAKEQFVGEGKSFKMLKPVRQGSDHL